MAHKKTAIEREIETWGPYEVIEEIGRGGMGVVYKARETRLKKLVAIKVLIRGEGASDEEVLRFKREAEAAAKLQHSNIVPIHAVGEAEGKHYFVMDYIQGEVLTSVIRSAGVTPRGALELTEQIADALHYAHLHGVIHRDMKPANVIVDAFGRPQIMDFGLAKQIGEDQKLTRTGTTMGTPAYMPPEQAEGNLKEIDARSDVYSIGAVLYEMLMGEPPFEGPSTMSILMKVLEQEPPAPRTVNPRIHRDIETICLKAMEKDKRRRYQSAAELADDIRRFKAGEAIRAAPASIVYRAGRLAGKNKAAVALFAVFGAVLVTLGVRSELRSRREERQARERLSRRVSLLISGARAALAEGDFEGARDGFKEAFDLDPENAEAKKGLEGTKAAREMEKARRYIQFGNKFLEQRQFEAAREMFNVALDFVPESREAETGLKKSRGDGTLTVASSPSEATVYALRLDEEKDLTRKGKKLGRTPLTGAGISLGTHKITVERPGCGAQEFQVRVGRCEDVKLPGVLLPPLDEAGANMVRVEGGEVEFRGLKVAVKPFYIDRYEYPNAFGATPVAGASWIRSRASCEVKGARLCSVFEWLLASPSSRRYPYGDKFAAGACAVGLKKGPLPAGMRPRCVSPCGAFDMTGNVSEWVGLLRTAAFLAGGDWASRPDEAGCRTLVRHEPERPFARGGFRCCRGGDAKALSKAEESLAPELKRPEPVTRVPTGMVKIPGGVFLFDDGLGVESEVELGDYCVDKYEFPDLPGSMPKHSVNWVEAAVLCAKRGKRLCSSAEWQRACRGPENLTYPYGHSYKPEKCVAGRGKKASPDRSGTHPECRSGWGVYDMSGNLSEWVEDYRDRARGTRVVAGGSFAGGRFETKCAAREGYPPRDRSPQIGFRCCASLREPRR